MNNKKIDIIEKYCYPVAAGIEVNIVETYSTLVEEGWDVTVHTSRDILTEKNVLDEYELHRGLKIKRYHYSLLGYFPAIDWENTGLVCLHNFNVVPHFFIMLRTLVAKIAGRKKYALVLTPHGGFNPEWRIFPAWIAFVKRIYHYSLGALLINISVDGVRAVSEWEKREMILHGLAADKVRVISNGVEDAAFYDIEKEASEKIKKETLGYGKYIIQIGRVYMIKNYETTLRALALCSEDINYVIVGPLADLKYKSYLDKLIEELGLTQRVFFTGVVRGVDKFYLIKHAQLMVHMALWESFCNVVHEGMSQGQVCIVANNTALPLLIKNDINGYCLPTNNYKLLAQKIQFVIDNQNSEKILKIKENNYIFGRQHTWRMVSEKMGVFYTELRYSLKKK